eukprot:TRINITY_DN5929_c0_g1_i1.p2 TRINITY_DN5929_c0_g1~~TRINITY_DN5929_c0_g1_i1.p2  ORF type:complete len:147 (+),score=39.65 TRINITY_DN5929_c0_g1_i1:52-441(+)
MSKASKSKTTKSKDSAEKPEKKIVIPAMDVEKLREVTDEDKGGYSRKQLVRFSKMVNIPANQKSEILREALKQFYKDNKSAIKKANAEKENRNKQAKKSKKVPDYVSRLTEGVHYKDHIVTSNTVRSGK